jgi:hypothetical protein
MDVMRDPGGEDMLEQFVGRGGAGLMDGIRGLDNDEETMEDVDQPLMSTGEVPPSNAGAGKHQEQPSSYVDMESEAEEEESPPQKRQCIEIETGDRPEVSVQSEFSVLTLMIKLWILNNLQPNQSQCNLQNPSDELADTSTQATLPPVPPFPLSDASAPISTFVAPSTPTENSDSSIVQSNSKLEGTLLYCFFGAIRRSNSYLNSPRTTAFRKRQGC